MVLGISIYGRAKTKVFKNVEDANMIMRCKRACVHVVCPDFNWLTGGRGIAYFKLVNILVINVHAKSYFVFLRT